MANDAALAARINSLLTSAPRDELLELHGRIAERAFAEGLWKERDGARVPVPFSLRPRLTDAAEQAAIQDIAWNIRMAARRLCWLMDEIPEFQSVVPLSPPEREWITRYRVPDHGARLGERLFCRIDVLIQRGPARAPWLRLLELNVVGIGGLTYSDAIARATSEVLGPWLRARDPGLVLEPQRGAPLLLLDELLEHARRQGVTDRAPTVALVEDLRLYSLGGEMGRLVERFEARGVRTVLIEPHELERARDGSLAARGVAIDVVYRFLSIEELVEYERERGELAGVRRAFETGRMIPSAGGDLEHKSVMEVFTRPDLLPMFAPAQRAALRGAALWTRLLRERETEDADGVRRDLVPWTRDNRARLVLKPNRGYGGAGVIIGPAVAQGDWERALDAALARPDEHVVQQFADIERHPLATLERGELAIRELYANAGIYPGRDAAPIFGRYADNPIVNLDQGGGVVPFLVQRA